MLPHSAMRCGFEYNIPRLFLNTLCSEDNHVIICPYLFYLYSYNDTVCYSIYLLSLEYIRDLDRVDTFLGVGGKVGRTEGGG